MSTAKLVGLFAVWVLASVMIAVVAAIVLTEVLRLVGVVEVGETSYAVSINVVFVIVFVGLVAVPFVLRSRFEDLRGDQQ